MTLPKEGVYTSNTYRTNQYQCRKPENYSSSRSGFRVYDSFALRITNLLPIKENCEAQGKGRAKGRPRKVTQRSFMDGGWWMVDILSLMLYTTFGCVTFPPPPPPTGSLLISRINLFIGQVR